MWHHLTACMLSGCPFSMMRRSKRVCDTRVGPTFAGRPFDQFGEPSKRETRDLSDESYVPSKDTTPDSVITFNSAQQSANEEEKQAVRDHQGNIADVSFGDMFEEHTDTTTTNTVS